MHRTKKIKKSAVAQFSAFISPPIASTDFHYHFYIRTTYLGKMTTNLFEYFGRIGEQMSRRKIYLKCSHIWYEVYKIMYNFVPAPKFIYAWRFLTQCNAHIYEWWCNEDYISYVFSAWNYYDWYTLGQQVSSRWLELRREQVNWLIPSTIIGCLL